MSPTRAARQPSAAPTLRPYQEEAIRAVIEARKSGIRRLLVCLPTGAGKTVIFSSLARRAKRPVLVLAHREELLHQARDKLGRAIGDPDVVTLERGTARARSDARVVVASIRSLHEKRLHRLVRDYDFGLVIYDECHHAAAEANKAVLKGLGAFDRSWTGTLLGVTATTQRGDGKGLDTVFEEIVYSRGIGDLIRDGYLSPLRGVRIATEADLQELRPGTGEDFVVEELAEAIDIESRNALVARSIQELARDRRTIAFCVTVRHAENLARALRVVGVPAGIVHGTMPREERKAVLAAFREGKLQALSNVGVLTEGFDDPGVSCIAMARPTRSEGLYAQCVGRGTRLHPGKRDCLVLDFADVSDLSLASLPSLFGMPRRIDLQGEDAAEAAENCQAWLDNAPGFEVPPETITLAEIKRRAEGFDPLQLDLNDELLAMSGNGWWSLGRKGLVLEFQQGKGRFREYAILKTPQTGRKRWVVRLDDRDKAHFSRLEDAVEAVDYEVEQLGRRATETASEWAEWRQEPAPEALAARLARRGITQGEARRLLAFEKHVGRGPGRRAR